MKKNRKMYDNSKTERVAIIRDGFWKLLKSFRIMLSLMISKEFLYYPSLIITEQVIRKKKSVMTIHVKKRQILRGMADPWAAASASFIYWPESMYFIFILSMS